MTPQGSVWLARLWALLVIFTVVLLVGPAGTYIYTGVSNTDRQTPRPPALACYKNYTGDGSVNSRRSIAAFAALVHRRLLESLCLPIQSSETLVTCSAMSARHVSRSETETSHFRS
eukprot:COSAG02_NODE_3293_length_6997_cov_1.765729_2_plen_116_part_00